MFCPHAGQGGLGMLGSHRFPHGTCQLSHKRFAHVERHLDSFVRPKSWEAIPFVSLEGLETVPPVAWVNRCSRHPGNPCRLRIIHDIWSIDDGICSGNPTHRRAIARVNVSGEN